LLQNKFDAVSLDVFHVHNRGISVKNTTQGLDRFANNMLPLLPGGMLIEFGLNDANVYPHNQVARL